MNDERGYRKIVVVLLLLLMVGAAALIIFYSHQVQVTVEGEGAVDPMEGETSIIDGLTLEVMPDDGWVVGQVTVDGDRVDVTDNRVKVSPSPFDFSTIDVVVTFIPDSGMSTLTVTSEGDGEVSPMGTTAQVHGSTVTVTAFPDEGSVIDEVLVDGVSVGSTNSIDVLMDVDHSVHVVFREVAASDIPITVTVDVDVDVVMTTLGSFYDWGDVEPHGTVYVEPGSSLTITVSLNPGFEVKDFTIDGVSDGSKLEHVLTDIHAPVEIGIFIFGYVNGYTVTASAGSGGSITPSGESIVAEGDDIKFILSPRSSYAVSHILLDGERVNVSGRTYTLTDVRDNHTVQAVFKYVGGGGSSDHRPVLKSIEVSGTFDTDYTVGQKFDSSGMVVIANYSDGSSKIVSDYNVTPSGGLTISDTIITVSYSDAGVTCQYPVTISVSDKPKELKVIQSGFYEDGQILDTSSWIVRVIYDSGNFNTVNITDCTLASDKDDTSDGRITLVEGIQNITISYTTLGVTLTCIVQINASAPTDGGFDVFVLKHDGVPVPNVHFHEYRLGGRIVQPGDFEVIELKVKARHDGLPVVLDISTITGSDESHLKLAEQIKVTVTASNGVSSRMLSEFEDRGHIIIEDSLVGEMELTLELSFEHLPNNNEVMGKSISFTMHVASYGGTD